MRMRCRGWLRAVENDGDKEDMMSKEKATEASLRVYAVWSGSIGAFTTISNYHNQLVKILSSLNLRVIAAFITF